jgi:very-short-patch-repair endonuclease
MSSSQTVDLCREFRSNPTEAEKRLWVYLRLKQLDGYRFRRQHPAAGCILDFYCPQVGLAIELDGNVHKDRTQIEYDQLRTEVLSEIGIEVIRFWNSEVMNNVDEVVKIIRRKLEERTISMRLIPHS